MAHATRAADPAFVNLVPERDVEQGKKGGAKDVADEKGVETNGATNEVVQDQLVLFDRALERAEMAKDTKALQWFLDLESRAENSYFHKQHGQASGLGTVLHAAADEGALEAALWLLEVGAEVNASDVEFGSRPLHLAAFRCHGDLVQVLLDAGADPWARDKDGETPVDVAKRWFCARGLGWFLRFGRPVLVPLLGREGPEAIEALENWKKETSTRRPCGEWMKRAHLRQRLRVILAQGREEKGQWSLDAPQDYANLKDQNICRRPEVKARMWYLPGFSAADACHEDVLEALVNAANEELFQTDTVQAIVQAAWVQMRFSTAWEVISCFLMVALLCVASYTFRHGLPHATVALVLITVLHGQKWIEECWQYVHMCRNRTLLLDFDNMADLGYILIGWWAIWRQTFTPGQLEKPMMSLFSGVSWLRLLYSLRGEMWMGPRLLPILSALRDTRGFVIVTVACVCGATHAYYNLQLVEDPIPAYGAFLQVLRLGIFGDFDLLDFEGLSPTQKLNMDTHEWEPHNPDPGPDYVWAHALFYVTGIGITILLMNLLIGILGNNFELYQDQSDGLFQRARAKMLLELQARPQRQFSRFLMRIAKEHVMKYRSGRYVLVLFVCALQIVFLPLLLLLALCVAIMLILCLLLQMRLEGIKYMVSVALGYGGPTRTQPMEQCNIFLVVRAEPPLEDLRSLRSEVKNQLKNLEKRMDEGISEQRDKLQGVEEKMTGVEKKLENLTSLIEQLIPAQPQPWGLWNTSSSV